MCAKQSAHATEMSNSISSHHIWYIVVIYKGNLIFPYKMHCMCGIRVQIRRIFLHVPSKYPNSRNQTREKCYDSCLVFVRFASFERIVYILSFWYNCNEENVLNRNKREKKVKKKKKT